MEMTATAIGQHYQAARVLLFVFHSGTYLICGTNPKFAKGSFQLHAGADKQLAGFKWKSCFRP